MFPLGVIVSRLAAFKLGKKQRDPKDGALDPAGCHQSFVTPSWTTYVKEPGAAGNPIVEMGSRGLDDGDLKDGGNSDSGNVDYG
jgi:hypothetical protein